MGAAHRRYILHATYSVNLDNDYVVLLPLYCQLVPSNLGLEWLRWRRVGGGHRQRLDPSRPHEGKELVRDLGQDVFGEAGHAQDVVPCAVDIIPEWDKLVENTLVL